MMADEVMLSLGSFSFSIQTAAYEGYSRSTAWRWASVNRHDQRPARQWQGPGEDTISLEGTVYTERAGLDQLNQLRKLGESKAPQILVDQYGNIDKQKWVVLSVEEKRSGFFADGAPRKQQFSVKLAAYGGEADG